jgi:hypothetical protein
MATPLAVPSNFSHNDTGDADGLVKKLAWLMHSSSRGINQQDLVRRPAICLSAVRRTASIPP